MNKFVGYVLPFLCLAIGVTVVTQKQNSNRNTLPLETVVFSDSNVTLGESADTIGETTRELSTLGESKHNLLTLGVSKRLESAILLNVPVKLQNKMPSGCEIVSASMLLSYLQYPISAEELVDKFLSCEETILSDDMITGPNPNKVFIGSPYKNGYGCYEKVIADCINSYWTSLGDDYYEVSTQTHSLEYLCSQFVDKGYPVMIWVTQDLEDVSKIYSWKDDETGDSVRWLSNEHCVLLVGYDEANYYVNDPLKGLMAYNKVSFKEKYLLMGNHCLTVKPKKERYERLF